MGKIAIKHARFSASECPDCEKLHAENARLVALLDAHGIDWRMPKPVPLPPVSIEPAPSRLSTEEKIALFRRLFRGRTDVYPIRWENKAGKSGYAPACANEWRAGVCEKPRIKCSDCGNRLLIPLSDAIIYDHLAGEHTIGGGKAKLTGKIDIAVMQSLSRQGEVSELVEDYGHIIVDECHHLSAFSFEKILKSAKARYVLGLTATPIRRDGQQPRLRIVSAKDERYLS